MESGRACDRLVIKVDRRHCPHCQRLLSMKTFKIHKRLYYDAEKKLWKTSDDNNECIEDTDSECSSPPCPVSQDDLSCLMDSDVHSPPQIPGMCKSFKVATTLIAF